MFYRTLHLLSGILTAALVIGSIAATPAAAQSLTPERETTCDPAVGSAIPLNDPADEAAVCAQRIYEMAATDTLALRQDHYDAITVEAWDGASIQVETVVVARRSAEDAARADVAQVALNRIETPGASRLFASGPPNDAPGWWSVRYRVRVPSETVLDIQSDNASIAVHDVVGGHRLRSHNGSLVYRLPAASSARLQAETENGRIQTTFPVATQGTLSSYYVDIVVGENGPDVMLATRNGDITIQRAQ